MANIKLFVDFWNFQLSWNQHIRPQAGADTKAVRINWRSLPSTLIGELPAVLEPTTDTDMVYKGTRVYASVNPNPGNSDEKLKWFLQNPLAQMAGYRVDVRDRRSKEDSCPACKEPINRMVEKGVDSSIVTDLFEGAINDAYDIALLISNDSDFVPAIETIQERLNRRIIHVGFKRGGHHVRRVAWSHILLDGDVSDKLKFKD